MVSKDGVEPLNLYVVTSWMNPEGSVETCMGSNYEIKACSVFSVLERNIFKKKIGFKWILKHHTLANKYVRKYFPTHSVPERLEKVYLTEE